ncbi:MAG: SOS response-associated peptidase [Shimia sp.]
MPGRLWLERPCSEVAQALGATSDVEDAPRHNISPGQPIITFCEGRLTHMRWGIIPVGRTNARGRPVMETLINARSETVFDKSAYAGVRRCIVPADGWYEWTGAKGRKTPWRLSRTDGALCLFAAIYDVWVAPGGTEVAQVATITCEPNEEVRPIHHRMGVMIAPPDLEAWLNGAEDDARALLRTPPNGTVAIEKDPGVDWDGP